MLCLQSFREFYLLVEQPKGSKMFCLPEMIELLSSRNMKKKIITHFGAWDTSIELYFCEAFQPDA